jgi:hypothetical protein
MPLWFVFLPYYWLSPARGSPCQEAGWAGRERKNGLQPRKEKEGTSRRRKDRLNLASFKFNVLGKLCYMITLITQRYATIFNAMS